MKRFLLGLLVFFSLSAVFYVAFNLLLLPKLLVATNGPNIEDQLNMSFANAAKSDAKILILGNSREYCGVNPDKFSIKAYNFSHNNDSYNQLYYKLMWILDKGVKPQCIVLGIDYFQFSIFSDMRNYAYGPLLGKDYLADYKKKKNYKLDHYKSFLKPEKVRKLVKGPNYMQSLKANGQYVRNGVPDEADFLKRNPERKEIQVKYFEKILAECKAQNIKVFLCMMPLRPAEIQQYKPEDLADFNRFVGQHLNENVVYLDYSRDTSFKMEDYIDFSHINQKAADRFSLMLDRDIFSHTAPAYSANTTTDTLAATKPHLQ
jgi:hypothetical protein